MNLEFPVVPESREVLEKKTKICQKDTTRVKQEGISMAKAG